MLLDQTRGEPPTGGSDPQSLRSVCNRTSKNVWHVAQQKLQMTEGVVIRDVCLPGFSGSVSGAKTDKLNGYNQPEEEEGLAVALFTCYDSAASQPNGGAVCVLLWHTVCQVLYFLSSTFPLHIAPSCVDAPGSSFRGNTGKLALQRVNIFLRFL